MRTWRKGTPLTSAFGLECATAKLRAGSLHLKLGRYKTAESRLGNAIDEFSELVSQSPQNAAVKAGLAEAQQMLGRLYRYTGRNQQSKTWLRQSVDEWARLIEKTRDPKLSESLIHAQIDLAAALVRQDSLDESDDLCNQVNNEAISLLEQWPEERARIHFVLATSCSIEG